MRIPITLSAILLFTACSSAVDKQALDPLTIRYSGTFKLELPASEAAGANVLYADGPLVRLRGGEVISGVLVTRELEALPADFDLASYPRYLLGLDVDRTLTPDLQTSFDQSLPALGLGEQPVITTSRHSDVHFYSVCGDHQRCVLFVVSPDQKHHILMLSTEAMSAAKVIKMIGVN